MKVLALTLLLAVGTFAGVKKQIMETGPVCPIDDPLDREDGPLNVTLHPIGEIFVGSTHGPLHAVGLSTFVYEYTVNLLTLTIDFTIDVASIDLETTYEVDGWLDATPFSQEFLPSGNFTGMGAATFKCSGINLVGQATLFVNLISNKVSIRLLSVSSLTIGSLEADLGAGYLVNGSPIDWKDFNDNFDARFAKEWAEKQTEVVEKVRTAVNIRIAEYTLEELLDLIGGDEGDCETPMP